MHLFLIEGKMMRLEFTSAVVLGGGRFRARERRYVVPRSDQRRLGKVEWRTKTTRSEEK